MEINDYKILIVDDDEHLLNLFKKWCDKSFKNHNFILTHKYNLTHL